MAKRQWYMEFVPGDWLTDPAVSLLKPATRGVWIDAIAVMHQMEQCGQIIGTVADLSRLCRCTPQEMRAAIEDLKQRNAADVTESKDSGEMLHVTPRNENVTPVVTLVNRRMRRLWLDRKSSANRVMRHRDRKRNGTVTQDVTWPVTAPLNLSLNPNPKEDKRPAVAGGGSPSAGTEAEVKDPEFWPLFPAGLKTPAVRAAWAEWLQHRRERRPKVTPTAARKQVAALAEMGEGRAVAALKHSTANGYVGLFEPSRGNGRAGTAPAGKNGEDPWNPEPEGMDPDRAAELLRETMGRDDE